MNGGSLSLADRVASLLPKTTAGACVPTSPWVSHREECSHGGHDCCVSYRDCHYSCHGKAVCSGWHVDSCS